MDVTSKRWLHVGCSMQPPCGVDGSKQERSYALCTSGNGMTAERERKRCRHVGCSKQPSHCVWMGATKRKVPGHKRRGMVGIRIKGRSSGESRGSSVRGRGGGSAAGDAAKWAVLVPAKRGEIGPFLPQREAEDASPPYSRRYARGPVVQKRLAHEGVGSCRSQPTLR